MTDLSPAARAVLDAFRAVPTLMDGPSIAGALRAAADQVVPENLSQCETYTNEAIRLNQQGVRAQMLAIAAELRGQP